MEATEKSPDYQMYDFQIIKCMCFGGTMDEENKRENEHKTESGPIHSFILHKFSRRPCQSPAVLWQ